MRKKLLLSIFLLPIAITACNSKNTNTEEYEEKNTVISQIENTSSPLEVYQYVPKYFFNYYEGLIDNKYPIGIVINKYNNSLESFYFYKKERKNISFSGKFEDNHLYLSEITDDDSKQIEKFELYFIDEHTIKGKWISNNKKLNVTLSQTTYPNDITQIDYFVSDSLTQKAKIKNYDNEVVIIDYWKTSWEIPKIKLDNPTITNKINKTIEKLVCSDDATTIEEEKEYLRQQEKKMLSTVDDEYDLSMPFFTNNYVSIDYNLHNILELNYFYSSWAGGTEHYGSKTILINTLTGNPLKFEDCFLPIAKPIILHLVKKQLKENHSTDDETLDNLKLDRMFGLVNNGIIYYFDKYEVAIGASGSPYVYIPFSELNTYIKDNGALAPFKN